MYIFRRMWVVKQQEKICMDRRTNFLFICSDQHSKFEVGCYGNQVVQTPNIDQLAAHGTRFAAAYSNNPICVPARACIATGQYGFRFGCNDNASPYDGQIPSFGHRLQEQGIPMTTIGKLHYKDSSGSTGFADQRIPLHVKSGKGDVYGLLRDRESTKYEVGRFPLKATVGTSSYLEYDTRITEEAVAFLEGKRGNDKPWVCYIGYTLPHFPLVAPKELYDGYKEEDIPLPFARTPEEWNRHPSCEDQRRYYGYEQGYSDEVIRHARHVYYGMCTFVDRQVGIVLRKLKEIGEDQNTIILYTTDHGENGGNHGMWNKNILLESSAAIPMILAGKGIPGHHVCNTPVSLVDIYETILDSQGAALTPAEEKLPGRSLLKIAREPDDYQRCVFSEFHATGSVTGGFMIRDGVYKYIYYVGYPPQLFHIIRDPRELHDLAADPESAEIVRRMDAALRSVVNPEQVNAEVKARQEAILNANGGRETVRTSFVPVIYSPAPTV